MANEKIYAKGFYGKQPRSGAPDFVKGTISIKVTDAVEWLKENENEKGYVNLDILEAKESKLNLVLNNYKPKED